MAAVIERNRIALPDLAMERFVGASPAAVFRAWTDPAQVAAWWGPHGFANHLCAVDAVPGGHYTIHMKGPEGQEFPSQGVFLEVVPNKKLVFTDAYTRAWEPSAKPFMTATVTFEDQGGRTKYTARALHWSVEDMKTHEKMGFHEGWNLCADQLEKLAKSL